MILILNHFRKRKTQIPEIQLSGISFPIKRYCESATSLPLLDIPHYCAGPSVCQGAVDVHPDTDMHLLALDYDNEIVVCIPHVAALQRRAVLHGQYEHPASDFPMAWEIVSSDTNRNLPACRLEAPECS